MGSAVSKALSSAGSAVRSAGSGLGSAAGSGAGNLVSEVVVQGARQGLGSGLGSGLSSALGQAGGSALGTALSGGGGSKNVQTPRGPEDATVSELVVQGTPKPALANMTAALPSALSSMDFGSSAGESYQAPYSSTPPLAQVGNPGGATDVSELVVEGRPQSNTGVDGSLLGGAAGVNELGADLNDDQLYDYESVGDAKDKEGSGLGEKAGILGLLASLGLNPKDLLGMGLLAAPLLMQPGGGGQSGQNTDNLNSIAKNNTNLANTMSQIAQAGMEGNIGGKGLNAIRRAVRASQAAIKSRYGSMGMSGSTAEAADLNAAAQAGVDMQFKVGQEMAQTGLQQIAALTGQSANIYGALLNAQTQKDTALGNALAKFAGATAGRFFGA